MDNNTTNLSKHRLNSYAEISNLMSSEGVEFQRYLNKIYKALSNMNPCCHIDIIDEVAPENRAKFIKIACLFISEGNGNYIFNTEYTKIKRLT